MVGGRGRGVVAPQPRPTSTSPPTVRPVSHLGTCLYKQEVTIRLANCVLNIRLEFDSYYLIMFCINSYSHTNILLGTGDDINQATMVTIRLEDGIFDLVPVSAPQPQGNLAFYVRQEVASTVVCGMLCMRSMECIDFVYWEEGGVCEMYDGKVQLQVDEYDEDSAKSYCFM